MEPLCSSVRLKHSDFNIGKSGKLIQCPGLTEIEVIRGQNPAPNASLL